MQPNIVPFKDMKLKSNARDMEFRTEKIDKILLAMSKTSGLIFSSRNVFVGETKILLRNKDCKLFELMDAISSIQDNGWNKIGERKYQLDYSLKSLEEKSSPKDEFTKSIYAIGKECMDFIRNSNDPKLQNAFKNGVNIDVFPEETRQALYKFANTTAGLSEQAVTSPSTSIRITDGTRSFADDKNLGAPQAQIEIRHREGGAEFGRVFFAIDANERCKELRNNAKSQERFNYEKQNKSESVDLPKHLSDILIDFNAYSTVPMILWELNERYNINFCCDNQNRFKMTKRFSCESIPLTEFVKLIEKTFPGSECEIRPSGFVVARGPLNPWVQNKKIKNE